MVETLPQMVQESIKKFSNIPALMHKKGGTYQALTYKEMGAQVRAFATALASIGIARGDRVAILSENRPEWVISDFAMAHVGAVSVGIFPTIPAGQVEYIVADSGARCLIVSDREQLTKALAVRKAIPKLIVISMNNIEPPDGSVLLFSELVKSADARPMSDAAYEELWKSVKPGDWASIIYTSGTTAEPRGAVLSHWNFVSNFTVAREVISFGPGEVLLSFIPLNHVFGRMVDLYLSLSQGATIAYVENLRRLRRNLAEVRPQYMALVPRVLEMFEEGLTAAVAKESPAKQRLFAWALAAAKAGNKAAGRPGSVIDIVQARLADLLVFRGIRKRLGLDRLRFFFAGGAPLHKSTGEFFSVLRISIMEGYGLSETSPFVTVNPPGHIKIGTVGKPFREIEVRIAEDGEILVRGPNVMQGYYKRQAETAETIDPDGWLHTGDIGEFDADGYLTITDRKKNLIVLANGKKVAPQHLEDRLLESRFIGQAVIVGDQQNTVGALLVPRFDLLKGWARTQPGLGSAEMETLLKSAEVQRLIRDEIQRLSEGLADYEKVRRFALLDHELTMEGGELTPTLKLKRRVVLEKYKDVIERLYS